MNYRLRAPSVAGYAGTLGGYHPKLGVDAMVRPLQRELVERGYWPTNAAPNVQVSVDWALQGDHHPPVLHRGHCWCVYWTHPDEDLVVYLRQDTIHTMHPTDPTQNQLMTTRLYHVPASVDQEHLIEPAVTWHRDVHEIHSLWKYLVRILNDGDAWHELLLNQEADHGPGG